MKDRGEQQGNLAFELCEDLDTRIFSTLLVLKGILMVAAIVLISSTDEISKAERCDLEKVLHSLSVDNTAPCKYDAIKKKSTDIRDWGISLVVLSSLVFILIFIFMWIPKNNKIGICTIIVGSAFAVAVAITYSVLMIKFYDEVLGFKENQTNTNYAQIKSSMIYRLQQNYTSDNVTSGSAISISWNKFFIEYECCAVNQVLGTTNDFDSTPWCTTSGSCQATASQIPRTCCNYVTEDDYGSVSTNCHSSVSPGTYKSNCMIPIKTLSVVNIEECQVTLLLTTLLIIGTLETAETLIELTLILAYLCCWIRNRIGPEKETNDNVMEMREKEKNTNSKGTHQPLN